MNIDTAKSYSTEPLLERAIIRMDLHKARYIVVCNRKGRFTAIFTVARCNAAGINAGEPAQRGFFIVN